MDELQAVNTLLRSVNTAPVSEIDTANIRVALAKETLDRERERILTMSWWFNKEKITVEEDVDGRIAVPETYLKVDKYDTYNTAVPDILVRGSYLYNKTEGTNVFTGSMVLIVTKLLDWDDIPTPCRELILAEARLVFVSEVLSSSAVTSFMVDQRERAMTLANQANTQNSNINLFTSNDTRYDTVSRRRNRRRRV